MGNAIKRFLLAVVWHTAVRTLGRCAAEQLMTSGIIALLTGAVSMLLSGVQGLGLPGQIGLWICLVVAILSTLLFLIGIIPSAIGRWRAARRYLKRGADRPEIEPSGPIAEVDRLLYTAS